MTDRELLELAAKAAGVKVHGLADKFVAQHSYGKDGLCIANNRGGDSLWNPLADDGDALRLAVKLEMFVGCPDAEDQTATARKWDKQNVTEEVHNNNNDPCAATRRAIVRAAAEIGKGMAQPVTSGLEEAYYDSSQYFEDSQKEMK